MQTIYEVVDYINQCPERISTGARIVVSPDVEDHAMENAASLLGQLYPGKTFRYKRDRLLDGVKVPEPHIEVSEPEGQQYVSSLGVRLTTPDTGKFVKASRPLKRRGDISTEETVLRLESGPDDRSLLEPGRYARVLLVTSVYVVLIYGEPAKKYTSLEEFCAHSGHTCARVYENNASFIKLT